MIGPALYCTRDLLLGDSVFVVAIVALDPTTPPRLAVLLLPVVVVLLLLLCP
jgi:hypothetical protein